MRTFAGLTATVCLGLVTSVSSTGCSSAEYRGSSPSVRSFTDVPREPRDVYVGMNWKFTLDNQSAYHATPYEAATAAAPTEPPSTATATTDQD